MQAACWHPVVCLLSFLNTMKNDLLLFLISCENPSIFCILLNTGEKILSKVFTSSFDCFSSQDKQLYIWYVCVKGALQ